MKEKCVQEKKGNGKIFWEEEEKNCTIDRKSGNLFSFGVGEVNFKQIDWMNKQKYKEVTYFNLKLTKKKRRFFSLNWLFDLLRLWWKKCFN